MRLTVAFGISSAAVWLPAHSQRRGLRKPVWIMAGIAAVKAVIVMLLPDEPTVVKTPPRETARVAT